MDFLAMKTWTMISHNNSQLNTMSSSDSRAFS